jgi:nucleotide-binding universal stress UspA family protein
MGGSILVGTDGSSAAGAAVDRAVQLARAFECRLLIVSAYAPGPAPADPAGAAAHDPGADPAWEPHARDEALELLASAERIAREHGIAEVETLARVGDGADAILDVAEEQRCELIVVGHTGRTGATRFLLGSVPSKVSHYAPCSVLIVRSG